MTWLVTGGAGCIGAPVVAALRVGGVLFVQGDVLDAGRLQRLLSGHAIQGVVHLAANKESRSQSGCRCTTPSERRGAAGAARGGHAPGVASFLFSSSAAVSPSPREELVREDPDCQPVNPDGTTKQVGERSRSYTSRSTVDEIVRSAWQGWTAGGLLTAAPTPS